jgi:hypothetical protein
MIATVHVRFESVIAALSTIFCNGPTWDSLVSTFQKVPMEQYLPFTANFLSRDARHRMTAVISFPDTIQVLRLYD